MKRPLLLFLLVLTVSFSNAQNIDFTVATPRPDLIQVYGGSFASGDIDGDGDQDLIIAGQTPGRATALYLSDGSGNFTEVTTIPFPEATSTVTILEDLDGDGDLDLFFSGNGASVQEFAHIYLNDGLGVFTQLANPSLPQFAETGVAIGDVDGDLDLDLLISTKDGSGTFVADVFLNDGNANFTASGSTVFTPVQFSAIAFIDVEGDGDADVVISGEQQNGSALTTLYLNDGTGNYSVDATAGLVQMKASDIDVADTDNDGDPDLLMSGTVEPFAARTILYTNDGNGQFTELVTAGLQQTFAGTNAIADLDNDGDQDILVIGSQNGGLPNIYNIVYDNLGNNNFNPVDTLGGEYIAACVIDDFNGDSFSDIIIQGFADDTNVYWNTSLGATLGAELLEFVSVVRDQKVVDLSWVSTQEENLDRYEVQRSTEGVTFTTINQLPAAGNTNRVQTYSLTDETPLLGQSYYRLRMVDFDGTVTFSDVRSVMLRDLAERVVVYPNPLPQGQALKVSLQDDQEYTLEIFTSTGQRVGTYPVSGEATLSLPKLPAGVYGWQLRGKDYQEQGVLVLE